MINKKIRKIKNKSKKHEKIKERMSGNVQIQTMSGQPLALFLCIESLEV